MYTLNGDGITIESSAGYLIEHSAPLFFLFFLPWPSIMYTFTVAIVYATVKSHKLLLIARLTHIFLFFFFLFFFDETNIYSTMFQVILFLLFLFICKYRDKRSSKPSTYSSKYLWNKVCLNYYCHNFIIHTDMYTRVCACTYTLCDIYFSYVHYTYPHTHSG